MIDLVTYAMSFIGTPYIWGGSDPINGFDCSGFVQELLASIGFDPKGDQTAQGLYEAFKNSAFKDVHGPGALAFYGKDLQNITHVTMMINSWQCVGANGGGSKTTSRETAAAADAFIKVRPVDYRSDLLIILMPNYNR